MIGVGLMGTEMDKSSAKNTGVKKNRVYAAPELTVFGSVSTLTGSGILSGNENGGNGKKG